MSLCFCNVIIVSRCYQLHKLFCGASGHSLDQTFYTFWDTFFMIMSTQPASRLITISKSRTTIYLHSTFINRKDVAVLFAALWHYASQISFIVKFVLRLCLHIYKCNHYPHSCVHILNPDISQRHCFEVIFCGRITLQLQEFFLQIIQKKDIVITKLIPCHLHFASSASPSLGNSVLIPIS